MTRRILIVEPDPKVSQELFGLFHFESGRSGSEDYRPEIAESVAQAVELSQVVNYHCIIMDVNLPEIKGYEAISLMRTINNNPPIIITTDKNSLELEAEVRQQDVHYYHIRAFGLEELKTAVQSIFENWPKVERSRRLDLSGAKPVILKRLQSK